jgi:Flp pilus assembly pilin Flp
MPIQKETTQPKRRRHLGVALTEYALLGILVTVTCLAAMQLLGGSIVKIVNDSCYAISAAINGAMAP